MQGLYPAWTEVKKIKNTAINPQIQERDSGEFGV